MMCSSRSSEMENLGTSVLQGPLTTLMRSSSAGARQASAILTKYPCISRKGRAAGHGLLACGFRLFRPSPIDHKLGHTDGRSHGQ